MIKTIEHNSPDLKNNKVAVFDFDWTLVCPYKTAIWSRNREDWRFLYSNTKNKIEEYYENGYSIIIVTYQSKKYKLSMLQDFADTFDNIPLFIVIGDKDSKKDFDLIDYLEVQTFDSNSFYCGDADGEEGSWSDMDLLFAKRNKLTFYKPSVLFRTDVKIDGNHNMIIMCGSPGSGKSTFVRDVIQPMGYTVVSSDDYKSNTKKIQKVIKDLFKKGIDKIVVDGCNPTLKNRQAYIDMLEDNKTYTTIYLNTPRCIAMERNNNREARVPDVAINMWFTRFEDTNIDTIVDTL